MNKVKIRIAAYVAVFLVTAVLTYIFAISDITKETTTSNLTSAGLPVVHMKTESGIDYNYLYGYTCPMDQSNLRSVITPVNANRELSLVVQQYGCVISGISYEVRDLTGEELIERTTLSDYTVRKGMIYLNLKLKNLLLEKQEYMLVLKIHSEVYGTIDYYSRVVVMNDSVLEEQIKYAKWFSNCTRSPEEIGLINARLEIDKNADNSNLGHVTNHCKQSQVGYGDLQPELTSNLYPSINEVDGNLASITLNYTLQTQGEYGMDAYRVHEYFRLNRVNDQVTYVNTYERYMDQIYDESYGVTLDGKIYLGIHSDETVETGSSPNGYVNAYVQSGNLWLYNTGKNTISKIFTFEDANSDGFREENDAHRIKILNVENNGDTQFLVYGYMNRGIHEGKCGISLCRYTYATEMVQELAFIESDRIVELMEDDVEQLAYMNARGNLYFYRNHTIYYVNCENRECMMVASDVNKDSMILHNNVVLFQKGDDLYHNERIYLLDMEEGNTTELEAQRGTYIRTLGFIDDNIVYGICNQDMVSLSEDGIPFYPMRSIILMDMNLELIKDYSKENYYVTGVAFSDLKIVFSRQKVDEETGLLVPASGDELLSNLAHPQPMIELTSDESEKRQKEYHLTLRFASYCKEKARGSKVEYSSDSLVYISNTAEITTKTYKVYGVGKLVLSTTNLALAAQTAHNTGGVVCNAQNAMIWSRYKIASYALTIPELYLYLERPPLPEPEEGEGMEPVEEPEENDHLCDSTVIAAINTMLAVAGYEVRIEDFMDAGNTWAERIEAATGTVYDLRGNTIELSVYLTNTGVPLVVKVGPEEYKLVVGYNNSDVTLMDLKTGATKAYYISSINQLISQYGNVILGVPKANE